MENAHTKNPAECLAYFGVNEHHGLSPDQFKKNLDKYGYNGESLGIRDGVGGLLTKEHSNCLVTRPHRETSHITVKEKSECLHLKYSTKRNDFYLDCLWRSQHQRYC